MSRKIKAKKKLIGTELWAHLMGEKEVSVKDYSIKENFAVDQKIMHPKFGAGFIQKIVENQKVEVLFEDKARVLVQNK